MKLSEQEIIEIKERLCYYDIRNPDNDLDLIDEEDHKDFTTGKCYCDNCFYGRTKLANIILELIENKKL